MLLTNMHEHYFNNNIHAYHHYRLFKLLKVVLNSNSVLSVNKASNKFKVDKDFSQLLTKQVYNFRY